MTKITCDYCYEDLSESGSANGWRIKVSNDEIPIAPNVPTMDVYNCPPLKKNDYYFCWRKCLEEWIKTYDVLL